MPRRYLLIPNVKFINTGLKSVGGMRSKDSLTSLITYVEHVQVEQIIKLTVYYSTYINLPPFLPIVEPSKTRSRGDLQILGEVNTSVGGFNGYRTT